MKKIVSIILTFSLICSALALCVGAAGTPALNASAKEITLADTVVISFDISGNDKVIGSAQGTLFYDSEAFEVTSTTVSSDYLPSFKATVKDDSTIRLSQSGGDSKAASGKIFALTFKPTANAKYDTDYEFAFGSKGRTTAAITSSGSEANGDIYLGAESEEGVKLFTVKVKIVKSFTVRYTDGVKGKAFKDQTTSVKAGASTPKFKGTPKRSGYTFKGWDKEIAKTVTGDVVYTAVWEKNPDAPKTYNVTYTDGVDGEEIFPDQTYTYTEGGEIPAFEGTPAREGYTFDGWTPDPKTTEITSDTVFTPKWKENEKFTVTYTDGVADSEIFADQTYAVEKGKPTPAFEGTPKREGYVFGGWDPEVSDTVTENVIYTAKWTEEAPSYIIENIVLDDDNKEESRIIEVSSPNGGDKLVTEYKITIGDDGYTRLYVDAKTLEGSTLPSDVQIKIICDDNGKQLYRGPVTDIPASVLEGLSGKDGEVVHVTATVYLVPEAGDKYAGTEGKVKVTFKIGEKDACGCFLCEIVRGLGGPYCICPWCWIILILIIVILVLVVIIIVKTNRERQEKKRAKGRGRR